MQDDTHNAALPVRNPKTSAIGVGGGTFAAYIVIQWLWGLLEHVLNFQYEMTTDVAVGLASIFSSLFVLLLSKRKPD